MNGLPSRRRPGDSPPPGHGCTRRRGTLAYEFRPAARQALLLRVRRTTSNSKRARSTDSCSGTPAISATPPPAAPWWSTTWKPTAPNSRRASACCSRYGGIPGPGVFETEAVEEGRGIHLRDLAGGDTIFVHDVTASRELVPRRLHPQPHRGARRQVDVRIRRLFAAARGEGRLPETDRQRGSRRRTDSGGICAAQRQHASSQDPRASATSG